MTDQKSQTAHQAGVLVVGNVLASLAEVVAPLIIVRLLGKAEVGVLTALLLVNTTLTMVLTVGLPGTLAFYLPGRPKAERRAIARRMARVLLGLGAGVAVLQLGIAAMSWADVIETEVRLFYLAALIGLPLGDLPMRMLPNMLVVEGHNRAAASTSIVRSLGMSLGTLVPLALGWGVWSVMWVLSGVGVLYGAVTWAYYRRVYGDTPAAATDVAATDMVRFSLPIGMTELVSNLNKRFDRFLIIPLGAVALAEYNAGSWQIPIVPAIAGAVGVAYGPHFAALFKQGRLAEAVTVWREQAAKTALLIVPISLVFVVAAEETITLLFTADYLAGASVLRYYSLMTMGRITAFGTILVAAGRPKSVFHSSLIAFGSNVALSVPLVLLIGFDGPALGSLLAFVPMVAAYAWYIGKAAGVPFRRVFPLGAWLRVVAAALPATAAAVAFKLVYEPSPLVGLVAEGAIVLVGFALVGTVTGLITRADWRYLARYVTLRLGTSKPADS